MGLYILQKIVAFLPFCRFHGHTAKPFAAPCRYAAKAAMRQNCLSCCAYLPITYAYIPLQKCRRFAVFTATAKPLAAPCSYAAKTDNAAELSAMPYAMPISQYHRSIYSTKFVAFLPHLRQYGKTFSRTVPICNKFGNATEFCRAVPTCTYHGPIYFEKVSHFAVLPLFRPHGKTLPRLADMLHNRQCGRTLS